MSDDDRSLKDGAVAPLTGQHSLGSSQVVIESIPLPDLSATTSWRGDWLSLEDEGGQKGTVPDPPPGALLTEMPVAIALNGDPYAVMMVTPQDLDDFTIGFAIAEGLVGDITDILDLCLSGYREPWAEGVSAHLTIRQACLDRLDRRRRATLGTVACGLCGTAEIAGALRPLPTVTTPIVPSSAALAAGLAALAAGAMGRETRAAHAAVLLDAAGSVLVVREDAGRHTALDKAIGAWVGQGRPGPTFALMSSRCSVELVQKAATAGLSALVTVGAATGLAAETANKVNLPLIARIRRAGGWRVA